MSVAAWVLEAPEIGASPAARWTATGRAAAAGTLVLGAAFQLAAACWIASAVLLAGRAPPAR